MYPQSYPVVRMQRLKLCTPPTSSIEASICYQYVHSPLKQSPPHGYQTTKHNHLVTTLFTLFPSKHHSAEPN